MSHVLLIGAVVGFSWAALLAQGALSSQLVIADEGRDFTLIGTVDNLPIGLRRVCGSTLRWSAC